MVTLGEHINNMKEIMRQLHDLGVNVEEDNSKVVLLSSLPCQYDDVIKLTGINATVSFEEIISTLLDEEKKQGPPVDHLCLTKRKKNKE